MVKIIVLITLIFFSAHAEELTIFGSKTFNTKRVNVDGNLTHFINENPDYQPGFQLDQELKVKIRGNITKNVSVVANLDDTKSEDEQREITVFIDGRYVDLVVGDFKVDLKDSEFLLYNTKLRGIQLDAVIEQKHNFWALITRSQGKPKTEKFQGKGEQQEYRLEKRPVVKDSEIVSIDSHQLIRGTDYVIDYEDGIITLKPKVLPIESGSQLKVEYEYEEGGSAYKRNLLGARWKTNFDRNNNISVSFIKNEDDKNNPVVEITPDTPAPMGHMIVDIASHFNIHNFLKGQFEVARSFKDDDLFSDDSEETGLIMGDAKKLNISATLPKMLLEYQRNTKSPVFYTIGKDDLSVDLGKWFFRDTWTPHRRGKIISAFTKSQTRIKTDPNPELNVILNPVTVDNFQRDYTASWDYWNKSKITGQFIKDNKMSFTDSLDNRKITSSLTIDHYFRKLNITGKVMDEDFINKMKAASRAITQTSTIAAGVDVTKKIKFSAERKVVETKNTDEFTKGSNTATNTYNMEMNVTRKLDTTLLLITRKESNYLKNEFQETVTADMSTNYRPSKIMRSQLKYKEEHITKRLRNNDTGLTYEEPVGKRVASSTVTISPNKKVNWRYQFNFNDEINEQTNDLVNKRSKSILELKYMPVSGLSTTSKYTLSENRSDTGTLTDRQTVIRQFNIKKSFRGKFLLEEDYSVQKEYERIDESKNTRVVKNTLKLEKEFSRIISTDYNYTVENSYKTDEHIKEIRNNYGVSYNPLKNMALRLETTFSKFRKLEYDYEKKVLSANMNYKLDKNSKLTADYKIIDSDNPAEGVEGYKAKIMDVEVLIRF